MKLTIMRGLPGSGKSSWVRAKCPEAVVCSADHFFEGGKGYQFDTSLLGMAHADCLRKALDAFHRKEEQVVIDNTNSRRWEFLNYARIAKLVGYEVVVAELVVEAGWLHRSQRSRDHRLAERNIHGVPLVVIEGMRRRWETVPEGELIDHHILITEGEVSHAIGEEGQGE